MLRVNECPLFANKSEAEAYNHNYYTYCGYLEACGLTLAKSHTEILDLPGKPVTPLHHSGKTPR